MKKQSKSRNPRTPKRFDVEFRDVTFSYDAEGPENASALSTRARALSSVSFHAEEGRVTALVGLKNLLQMRLQYQLSLNIFWE